MSKLCLLFFLLTSSPFAFSQSTDLNSLSPKEEYENITAQKLNTDSNATSIVIWIKKEVKPHYHATHSEHVYILEGMGKMLLGEKIFDIKPGDLIFIPQGRVHALRVTSAQPVKVLSIQSPEFDGSDRVMVEQDW